MLFIRVHSLSVRGSHSSKKLALHLVTARSPVVDLAQLGTILSAAATAAHFHSRHAYIKRRTVRVGGLGVVSRVRSRRRTRRHCIRSSCTQINQTLAGRSPAMRRMTALAGSLLRHIHGCLKGPASAQGVPAMTRIQVTQSCSSNVVTS